MAQFITSNGVQWQPLSLIGVGTTHGRWFVGYVELEGDEAETGAHVTIDAEAIGGPDDGWLQDDMQFTPVPAGWQRRGERFVIVWQLRLAPGECWKLTVRIDGRPLVIRNVRIRE